MHRIILGSESPRRKEILNYFSIPFEQASPAFNERSIEFKGDPEDYALALSDGKAASLHTRYKDAVIITADTIVYRQGKVYNKPRDLTEALRFLEQLSGEWHSVFTAVTVQQAEQQFHGVEETRVLMHRLSPKQMHAYSSSINLCDKAGAYAIQTAGGLIVQKIEGCYYNVMGLPIHTLQSLLVKVGLDLWEHLPKEGKSTWQQI